MCTQVVVNGVSSATGDQDTENTELMAIYTKENQRAEKVSREEKREPQLSCQPKSQLSIQAE